MPSSVAVFRRFGQFSFSLALLYFCSLLLLFKLFFNDFISREFRFDCYIHTTVIFDKRAWSYGQNHHIDTFYGNNIKYSM